MRSAEFCYWLQGYFELGSSEIPLHREQLACIRKHLKLVEKVERKLTGFPAWLAAVIEVAGDACDQKTHKAIVKKVGETFKHEIDGGYDDSDGLDTIHHGGGAPGGTLFRC